MANDNIQNIEKSNEQKEVLKPKYVPYGDYHTHTNFSDGRSTLEQNIQRAIEIGLKEYSVTDHAFRHRQSGITIKEFEMQKRMILLFKEKYPQIKLYHSLEANILGYNGKLDIDNYKDQLDYLIMGYHKTAQMQTFREWWSLTAMNFVFRPSKEKIQKNTLPYLRCIEKYDLEFVNHLNYGILVDVKPIAELCAQKGIKIELNGKRVFFSQKEVDDMLETGVDFVVNSDAHSVDAVGNVTLPVEFAIKHGIPLEKIVNLNKSLFDKE